MLSVVGNFGKFQRIVTALFCFLFFPAYHIGITIFVADTPSWRCATNSSTCHYNGSKGHDDLRRCEIQRTEWEYTTPKSYSIVTQWELDCDRKWLNDLAISIFFLGWIIGAPILGWAADTFGRRVVLIHSMNVLLVTTFVTAFVPDIYSFVTCRFVIGFLMTGTFPQMILIVTGIAGIKYHTFTSLMIFTFWQIGLSVLGLKAYFIREWKILYIVCSVPYIITTVFYTYIPESIHFLYVKGREKEIAKVFQRIARCNKKICPPGFVLAPMKKESRKSNPLDLFKSKPLAIATIIPSLAFFANIITYYALYFEAGNLGGSLYRDYLLITVPEVFLNILNVYLSGRFGLRPMAIGFTLCSTLANLGLVFAPRSLKFMRIAFGMIGKCTVGVTYAVLTTWVTNLIPPHLCSESMGIGQSFARLGGICAPWMNTFFTRIYKPLPFISLTALGVITCILFLVLPEPSGRVDPSHSSDKVDEKQLEGKNVTFQTNMAVELDEL